MNHTKNLGEELVNTFMENKEERQKIIKNAFVKSNNLIRQSEFDTNFSGSTAVTIILIGTNLICSNTGDSRAVLASIDNSNEGLSKEAKPPEGKVWKVAPLSRDHKPSDKKEHDRIISSNGRVARMRNQFNELVGPHRVWLKNENRPGLAMSRSIGDKVASKVGVIPTPEIVEKELNADDKFIIIASDGIWEFITNEEAVEIVIPFWEIGNPEGACKKLVESAVRYWKSEDAVIDDITVIVIFLSVYT